MFSEDKICQQLALKNYDMLERHQKVLDFVSKQSDVSRQSDSNEK
jgi:hypothetical protein